MTDLSSAIFSPGWQERNGGIGLHDLQWAATGERLTAESFARYRREGGMVAIHSIPEQVVRTAIADPEVMIASDGILDHGNGHPRAAGRSRACWVFMCVSSTSDVDGCDSEDESDAGEAVRAWLGQGRIQVGTDADIAVFDPDHVIDRATFEKPAQYSDGIPYVLVNGTIVVKDGKLQDGLSRQRIAPAVTIYCVESREAMVSIPSHKILQAQDFRWRCADCRHGWQWER